MHTTVCGHYVQAPVLISERMYSFLVYAIAKTNDPRQLRSNRNSLEDVVPLPR